MIKKEKMQEEMVGFDADPRFGPCKTISRLQRWNNAQKLGLEPPDDIPRFIN